MNTPSAQTISATTEVLELASLLDSRVTRPDKARILAWANQIGRHNLQRDDLLNAVQDFYDRPSAHPISVGDVIAGARRIKRDRLEQEGDEQREYRQEAFNLKALEDTAEIIGGAVFGPAIKTPRLLAAESALHCALDKHTALKAMQEFFSAKRQAQGRAPAAAKRPDPATT